MFGGPSAGCSAGGKTGSPLWGSPGHPQRNRASRFLGREGDHRWKRPQTAASHERAACSCRFLSQPRAGGSETELAIGLEEAAELCLEALAEQAWALMKTNRARKAGQREKAVKTGFHNSPGSSPAQCRWLRILSMALRFGEAARTGSRGPLGQGGKGLPASAGRLARFGASTAAPDKPPRASADFWQRRPRGSRAARPARPDHLCTVGGKPGFKLGGGEALEILDSGG